MEDDQNIQGVLRQRRNFLLVSSVLAAFLFLQVEFSEIQIFGVKFIVHNKDNLLWVFFAWWLYLFWRYFQYHSAIHDFSISKHYYLIVNRFADVAIKRMARKKYPDAINPERARLEETKPQSLFVIKFDGKLHFPTSNPAVHDYREAPFEMSRLWIVLAYILAFPTIIFRNHLVSDYLLPYAIGIVLGAIFLLRVPYV